MRIAILVGALVALQACGPKPETVRPTEGPITESVYASGIVESKGQYEVFATVSGIVDQVFVQEGDTVETGTPLLSIFNETQKLNRDNASLNATYADMRTNDDRLREAQLQVANAKARSENDSTQLQRQQRLWAKQIGSQQELEQRQLAFDNARSAYGQALIRYTELQRQLRLNEAQAKNNLLISSRLESDFVPKSRLDGVVYSVLRKPGELVGPQTALAVIGSATRFVLKMQVDEQDIFEVRVGQKVLVTLESYRDRVYEAQVTKLNPLMNDRNKTFEVEAEFVKTPERLLPNITFEANIIVQEKKQAMLLPARFLLTDSTVVLATGDTISVSIGLRDYQQVEILSGLTATDQIVLPAQ